MVPAKFIYGRSVLYVIVRIGSKLELAQKSRALLYSNLVRQTNHHAYNKPSCVERTVMRQANRHASTVMRQPSCVNRHASAMRV